MRGAEREGRELPFSALPAQPLSLTSPCAPSTALKSIFRFRKSCTFLAPLVLGLGLGGCASDKYLTNSGHRLVQRGQYAEAAAAFAPEAGKPGANQVLFMLDEASALFAARRHKEAIDLFLKAEKLMEIKDYTSISEEVGTLVTSSNVRGYKGEDFEKVLVNVYLAMAFASEGKLEGAQVEARKINLLLHRMITDGKRNYQESPFARYLSALLWEAGGQWNDAYIDYKKTYELDPGFPDLAPDLLAGARRMRFGDEYARWAQAFPMAQPRKIETGSGELIVFFEKGLGPRKIPRNQDSSLPRYVGRYSDVGSARVIVGGQNVAIPSTVIDVTQLSTRYLEDRIGRMAAAKLAGTATKAAIAYGVGRATKDENAGLLTFLLLAAMDRADLRCWQSLPDELQMARVPLPAGVYDVQIEVLNHSGEVLRTVPYPQLQIRPARKAFVVAR